MDVVTVPELCDYVNSLKVAELKEHIKAFNERLPFSPHLRLSGNKPQLAERVIETIVAASQTPQYYQELLVVLAPLGLTHWLGDLARMRHASGQCVLRHSPRYAASYGRTPTGAALAAPSLSLAAPVQSRAEPVPAVTQGSLKQLRFRRSPFYDVVEFASSIVQIPEAPPPSGRRQVGVSFTLSAQQVSRLLDTQYLRLFCTTSEQFLASISPARQAAVVEFPYTCEARVNERSLGVSLKGNKKHAGRVAPPDLNRQGHLHMVPGRLNRVELSYANTTMRYTMVIALCSVVGAEALVEELKRKKHRSKELVVAMLRQKAQDEEVETGASTLKLACPLTYIRMVTPCRANTCDHVQCFDALSFYSMNEQSPAWQCPVCSRDIQPDDLQLDGYVEDILRRVPDDLEYVLVEADGSWHSADGQYTSSDEPRAPLASAATAAVDLDDAPTPSPPPAPPTWDARLDAPAKREVETPPIAPGTPLGWAAATPHASPARAASSATTPRPSASHDAVIDLTLSSDDEG